MARKATAPPPEPEFMTLGETVYEIRQTTWGKLGVGSIILGHDGKRPWTCIAAAQPQQFEYGKTCWLKFQARNGDEFSAPPRYVNFRVKTLVDPVAPIPEPAWPDGAREAWLLAQELGAEEIATQDRATGEVWCPDYTAPNPERTGTAPLLRHLEICHAVDIEAILALEAEANRSDAAHRAHDAAHKHPVGGAGFPHRHVPEDHSIL